MIRKKIGRILLRMAGLGGMATAISIVLAVIGFAGFKPWALGLGYSSAFLALAGIVLWRPDDFAKSKSAKDAQWVRKIPYRS